MVFLWSSDGVSTYKPDQLNEFGLRCWLPWASMCFCSCSDVISASLRQHWSRSPGLTKVSSLRATLMLLLDRKERDRRLHKEISRTDCWEKRRMAVLWLQLYFGEVLNKTWQSHFSQTIFTSIVRFWSQFYKCINKAKSKRGYWKARSCQCARLLVMAWAEDRDVAWQHRQTTTDKQSRHFLQAGSRAGSAVMNQIRQGDNHYSSTGTKSDGYGMPAASVVTSKQDVWGGILARSCQRAVFGEM